MGWFDPISKFVKGVVSPIADIGLGILGYNQQVSAADKSYETSRESAREQMAFQERLSSTAIQRQMQDLKQAGLNPILAAKYGGASTPSGAGYEYPFIGEAVNSAVSAARNSAQFKQVRAQTGNVQQQTKNLKTTQGLIGAQEQQAWANSALMGKNLEKMDAEIERIWDEQLKIRDQRRALKGDIAAAEVDDRMYRSKEGLMYRALEKGGLPVAGARGAMALKDSIKDALFQKDPVVRPGGYARRQRRNRGARPYVQQK